MVSGCSFWRKSSKLSTFTGSWKGIKVKPELGIRSIIICESILWQFHLSRGLTDRRRKIIPSSMEERGLPANPFPQARTESMAGNFLFLTLISTFIPPGSYSRAITGFLFVFYCVPEQSPQWQQMWSNTIISFLYHRFTRTIYLLLWPVFISRISQRESLRFRKCHVHIQRRQRDQVTLMLIEMLPTYNEALKSVKRQREGKVKFCTTLFC